MGWSLEGVGPPSPSETVPAGFMQRVPTNYTADIEGSRPKVRRWATRKIGSLRTDDIEGARKKEKKTRLQKPDSHDIKDIDGAAPRKYGFRTERVVNPLEPVYQLPFCPSPVYPIQKFLRDAFDVSDIDGAKPKTRANWRTRDSYNVDDIEGAQVSWKSRRQAFIGSRPHAKKPDFALDVRDINPVAHKSSRCSNPLDPSYFIHGEPVFDSTRWRRRSAKKLQKQSYIYKTDDIPGAQSGNSSYLRVQQRTQFRQTNHVADIPGAQPNSRNGALSKRRIDPLNPRYMYLHGTHSPTPNVYGPTAFISRRGKKTKASDDKQPPLSSRSEPAVLPSRRVASAMTRRAKKRQVEIEEVRNLPDFM